GNAADITHHFSDGVSFRVGYGSHQVDDVACGQNLDTGGVETHYRVLGCQYRVDLRCHISVVEAIRCAAGGHDLEFIDHPLNASKLGSQVGGELPVRFALGFPSHQQRGIVHFHLDVVVRAELIPGKQHVYGLSFQGLVVQYGASTTPLVP